MTMHTPEFTSAQYIELAEHYGANNYHPLPVVLTHGEGAWVTDADGKRYLDFLSAYSALNFGHRHPALIEAAKNALNELTLTSRAVHSGGYATFVRDLCHLTGMDQVLPMNSGAEGVETALKISRKWGYERKGVEDGKATVVVCDGNFHGRTTTIISFSDHESARTGFGPFTPGFRHVQYGDAAALEALFAEDPNIVAFLVEPVQGEAGVVVPPAGYLTAVRDACTKHNVLMIADEIQTGFGRTGKTFACELDGVRPDLFILGKALGGGILPLSAVATSKDIMSVITPGTHGSTFGGNPLACAIGSAVCELVKTGEYQERSRVLGKHMLDRLRSEAPSTVRQVRGVGLWAGIELYPEAGHAHTYCERLLDGGIIAKDTHETTIRLAPPLMIGEDDLNGAIDQVLLVLKHGV